jgi:predicted permease
MNILSNLRYSLRQFRYSPVFTAAAVLTLALGIGGTTAIFSLMHTVMLRSLPVSDPAQLYRVGEGDDCCVEGGPQDTWGMFPYSFYKTIKENTPEFEKIAAFQAGGWRMSVRREKVESAAKPLRTEYVSGSYFPTLGVRAFSGRLLEDSDDQPSSTPTVVLSHQTWQTSYGGDPAVLGSTFMIEGRPFTVIGITPPGFFGETLRGNPPDIFLPLQQEPIMTGETSLLKQPSAAWLRVIGRAKPGVTPEAMGPRLTALLHQWMQNDAGYPANWMADVQRLMPKQVIRVIPAGAGVTEMKEEYGRSLQILLSVCGLVLLIACANVANLLLARAAAKRGQTAVRMAVGASRKHIIRQALTESVLLSIIGGAAGLLVAIGASRLLLSLAFHGATFLPISAAPSLPALGFAFLLALITGLIFGAAPAWFATGTDPAEALRGSGRATRDHSSWARKALLIVQATLSVVLVAGATMLARSLSNLEHQDFGYQVQDRIEVELNPPPTTYSQERLESLYRTLQQRLEQLPGVSGASLAMYNPLTDNWGELIMIEGHPQGKFNEDSGSSWTRVGANYLQVLGEPLVRGRYFSDADNETAPNVAMVNEAFVKRFFKNGEEPLDHHFGIDLPENAGTYRIVGVVKDARWAGFGMHRPPRPTFFVPLAQRVHYTLSTKESQESMQKLETRSHFITGILIHTTMSPGELQPILTKAMAEVDPNLTIITVRKLQQQIDLIFDQERAVASLAGLFGIVALLLAAVGLYGVTAYTVAQRTSEIGVRMALGANRVNVVKMVLTGAFRRVGVGLIIGIPLAIGAGKLIAAQLYGIKSWDPAALTVAAVSLAVCAFMAAMIPALRAAGISPMDALRAE